MNLREDLLRFTTTFLPVQFSANVRSVLTLRKLQHECFQPSTTVFPLLPSLRSIKSKKYITEWNDIHKRHIERKTRCENERERERESERQKQWSCDTTLMYTIFQHENIIYCSYIYIIYIEVYIKEDSI